jgi:putative ABC transport system ATP-binding protein
VVVQCQGVTKTYGKGDSAVRALRGADVSVHKGEMLMLVGPSGCGKTTLISVVAGVLDRDGGQCKVLGQDYANMNQAQKAAFRAVNVGFVFQAFNLIPTLTIAENVAVPLLINGVPRREALVRAKEVLTLDHATGQKVMELLRGVAAGEDLTLVVVTHDARIFEFADRIAEMDDGHIVRIIQGQGLRKATHIAESAVGK